MWLLNFALLSNSELVKQLSFIKQVFLFIGFIGITPGALAQDSSVLAEFEALQKQLINAQQPAEKSQLFHELSSIKLKQNAYQLAAQYADSARFYADKLNDLGLKFQAQSAQLKVALQQNDTVSAKAIIIESNTEGKPNPAYFEHQDYVWFLYLKQNFLLKYSKAPLKEGLAQYLTLAEIAQEKKHHTVAARIYSSIASSHRQLREMKKAFEYNQKEMREAKLSKDKLVQAWATITNLDLAYSALPWPIDSLELEKYVIQAKQATAMMDSNGLDNVLVFGNLYLSKFYAKQGVYDLAFQTLHSIDDQIPPGHAAAKYEQLCELASKTNQLENFDQYSQIFLTKAYATKRPFYALNAHNHRLNYALQANKPDTAKYYAGLLEHGLTVVDTSKYLVYLDFTYTLLAQYYESHDAEKATKYLQASSKINRRIMHNQKEAYSAMVNYHEKVDNLAEENTTLNASNSFFKNNLVLLLLILIVVLAVSFGLYRKYQTSQLKSQALEREKEDIAQKVERKSIVLKNKQKIYLDEFKYAKADGNYIECYVNETRILDRQTLKMLLAELPPNFIQTHRSYVINKNFIKASTSTTITLEPNIEIPLSRTFKNKLETPL